MGGFDAIAVGRRVLAAESEALAAQSQALDESFRRAVDLLFAARGRIICTGMGKSGHVARKIAATMASTGGPAVFVHPAEASHGDLGMIGPDDVILALSKSGEARELADILAYAKRFGIPLLAMTEAPDSALGRAADILLRLPAAPEATAELNAPTTSTTLQMALGDALLEPVRETLQSYAQAAGLPEPALRVSRFGDDVIAVGAAALAGYRLTQPTLG